MTDMNSLFDDPLAMAGLSVMGGKSLGDALTEAATLKNQTDYKNAQAQLWQVQAAQALQKMQMGQQLMQPQPQIMPSSQGAMPPGMGAPTVIPPQSMPDGVQGAPIPPQGITIPSPQGAMPPGMSAPADPWQNPRVQALQQRADQKDFMGMNSANEREQIKELTKAPVMTKDASGNPMLVDPRSGKITPIQGSNGQPAPDNSGLTGQDYLATLDPGMAREVKSIAEGSIPITGRSLQKLQPLLQAVTQYDPTFNASDYNARAKTRQSFTSGQDAANITALNTAMSHAQSLKDAYDKLGNTNYSWLNTAKNATEAALGDTSKQTQLASVGAKAHALSEELAKVFRSSGMAESDVKAWESKIDTSATPATSNELISSAMDLMNGRLDALGQKYNQGMGTSKNPIQLLSPKAQAAYQRLSGGSSINNTSAPSAGGWKIEKVQ